MSRLVYYIPLLARWLALSLSSAGTLSRSIARIHYMKDKALWLNNSASPHLTVLEDEKVGALQEDREKV